MRAVIETKRSVERLSAAELRARWRHLAEDPLVAAIPYKLELNERGSIEVSPAAPRHAFLQAFVARELQRLLPAGSSFTECPIETEIGIRVPDVVWASSEFLSGHSLDAPFERAPELCVEVLSPSNTRAEIDAKIVAYLGAGAREVWIVHENRLVEITGVDGPKSSSEYRIELVLPA
jgi:Uma2 family endonuclease